MTHNPRHNFWEINKASAFIDAMNAANHQPRRQHYPSAPVINRSERTTAGKNSVLKSVTFAGLAICCGGLIAINWIA